MRIKHGTPGIGKPLDKNSVVTFLSKKFNLQLSSIDEKGWPVIHPVWFYFDKDSDKIFISTEKNTKKIKNLKKNPKIFFSVDEDEFPYRCVRGKAIVSILQDPKTNTPHIQKICQKYFGSLEEPYAKTLIEMTKKGESVILEIQPDYFSTWDFSR